jgi:hypothetical protein
VTKYLGEHIKEAKIYFQSMIDAYAYDVVEYDASGGG